MVYNSHLFQAPDGKELLQVGRVFHPNFAAKWRRYFYILPLNDNEESIISSSESDWTRTSDGEEDDQINRLPEGDEKEQQQTFSHVNEDDSPDIVGLKRRSFSVSKVDQLLRELEGKTLSYKMFARDTKASRSM